MAPIYPVWPRWLVMLCLLALAGCASAPAPRPPVASHPPHHHASPPPQFTPPDQRVCLLALTRSQAQYVALPDQVYGLGCETRNAVKLGAFHGDGGPLPLANSGALTCQLAITLQGWAQYGVDRAAQAMLGSRLVRIVSMGSYACRNVGNTDRRSAHATANAIDIAGFWLADGRRITIARDWNSPDPAIRDFLHTIRASACKRFMTVLSPDYNAQHHDHFHLEVGGDRPLCS